MVSVWRDSSNLVENYIKSGPDAWLSRRKNLQDGVLRPPYVLIPGGRIAGRVADAWGTDCVGIGDSDPLRTGQIVGGVSVRSIEELIHEFPNATYVVCSAVFGFDIENRLRELGVQAIISYPLAALLWPGLFANQEYQSMGESIFSDDAVEQVRTLSRRLADDESRAVLWNKIAFYLTRDRHFLLNIKSKQIRYFSNDLVQPRSSAEKFVDVGAFDGDTLRDWVRFGPRDFDYYLAFEPDDIAFQKLLQQASDDSRIHCELVGLSDTIATVSFQQFGVADSRIVSGENTSTRTNQIETVRLDDFLVGSYACPTQVKMDIEGAERQAIKGAEETLSDRSVRISISAYHYPFDLWEIPIRLLNLRPDSSIYLRHYTNEVDDTVCYVMG
jgi:FkbM family methyltransferase